MTVARSTPRSQEPPDERNPPDRRDHVGLKALGVAGGSAGGISLIMKVANASSERTVQLAIIVFGGVLVVAILAMRRR